MKYQSQEKSIANRVPWCFKIAAKIFLSRVPLHKIISGIKVFRHGRMREPSYAYNVFIRHFERSNFPRKGKGFCALVAYAFGAFQLYLVDTGKYATQNTNDYRSMADFLRSKGLKVPYISESDSMEDVLEKCCARYEMMGLQSLRSITTKSIDFIWSHTVLQHIRYNELELVLNELRRIIREDGICSHRVDLRDCIGGSLNNLRFSKSIWESRFMAESGF